MRLLSFVESMRLEIKKRHPIFRRLLQSLVNRIVVEAYRLDRYDNSPDGGVAYNDTIVVEAYRLDRYDNLVKNLFSGVGLVVEAYRLDRYDNLLLTISDVSCLFVVEAYRLDRYDNFSAKFLSLLL